MVSSTQKLTRDESKLHNQRLALQLIYTHGEISRADIARLTGLTRTTVSAAAAELIEAGLVEEVGQGPSAGGKPPTLLRVVADARFVLGVDLSGATLQGAVCDLRGRIVAHATAQPTGSGDPHSLEPVWALIDALLAAAGRPVLGIGVGLPGLIDSRQGVVLQAVNRGWRDLPLGDLLAQRYGLPVYLANDSQAAALAELSFANPDGLADLAVLLVDEGISAGIVLDGRVYQGGNRLGASEIGHVRVVEGGEPCACGHFGCLETVASRGAIVRRAQAIYVNQPGSTLHSLVRSAGEIDLAAILQACRAGDRALIELVAQVGRTLSIAVANLATVLNLPLVVLAGSITALGPALVEPLTAELRQRMLPELAERIQVRISTQGTEGIIRGAAALVLSQELGVI
jgi:predicted NBD/HSP70 family sugar kinase